MNAMLALLRPLQGFLDVVLAVGKSLATIAIAIMVLCILAQVYFRYVLDNALPWPEEAARFLMLWMTGLIAPLAYRRGGFVAIDLISAVLPRWMAAGLKLVLLIIAMAVLIVALKLGHKHVFGNCLFKSATLWLPFKFEFALSIPFTSLDLTLCTRGSPAFSFTWGWTKMPLPLAFLSLYVGVILITLVNIEMMLRSLIELAGGATRLRPMTDADLPAGAD